MDKTQNYIVDSLELHLFFARIMKEHALFLSIGFLPPGANLANEGTHFLRKWEQLLSRAISLSDCVVRRCVLESGEVFTEFTSRAEQQTQRLTGTFINQSLTARVKALTGRDCDDGLRLSQGLVRQVQQINRDALTLVNGLIHYKERILRGVTSCRLYNANYPLLIEHILREARLYREHLMRLEGVSDRKSQELRDSELFWNQIMMEHALFIRGLLDPTEDALICTAGEFACDYKCLLEAADAAHAKTMPKENSLDLTLKFRDFKQAGVEGIEECKIRSLILPLLADHVLREANHYIRLLED